MRGLNRSFKRLFNFTTNRRGDKRLREEIESHIAAQTEENIRAGMGPEEARRHARLKFGAIETVREDYHAEEGLPLFEGLLLDIRYALRVLWKSPAFSLLAIMTIALGVGANTSIFTAVNGVLLKSFSFPEANRLVVVNCVSKSQSDLWVSYPDYLDWRAAQRVFVDLGARFPAGGIIIGVGEPQRVFGRYVTASFFSTLGIQPQIGGFFSEDEDKVGAPRVMVISDSLWRRVFNADPAVIGRAINYNGASWTVVGVLPVNFDFYGRSNENNDLFLPMIGSFGKEHFLYDRGNHPCQVIARLRPGVSEHQAAVEMNTIAARLTAQYPVSNTGVTVDVHSLLRDFVGEESKALLVTSAGAILHKRLLLRRAVRYLFHSWLPDCHF